MANFATHIGVGTLLAGSLATLTLAADVISPESLVGVTMAGVLGSVLPDIDLKDSKPSQIMFSGLALFFSFVALFNFAERLSIAEMWIIWIGTFLVIRVAAQAIFHRFAHHRGIWHSLLAAAFLSLVAAVIYKRLLGYYDGVSWLAGGFLFMGFMSHLILDEMYSVDVMDQRLKASFGTALKLFDARHPAASVAMALAVVGAFMIAPQSKDFRTTISSKQLWLGLQHRLVPQDRWFGQVMPQETQIGRPLGMPAPVGSNPIATGSIRPSSPAPAATLAPVEPTR